MSDDPLELELAFLLRPLGGEQHRWRREQAEEALLAAGEPAHARLLSLLDVPADEAPLAVVELLPRFGRAEAVPPLARLLAEGGERTAWHAGQSVGLHPADEAMTALSAALGSTRPETLAGALGGALVRGDPVACPDVLPLLQHAAASIRERAAATAAALGCLAGDG
jgi:HEAT repeat protein